MTSVRKPGLMRKRTLGLGAELEEREGGPEVRRRMFPSADRAEKPAGAMFLRAVWDRLGICYRQKPTLTGGHQAPIPRSILLKDPHCPFCAYGPVRGSSCAV